MTTPDNRVYDLSIDKSHWGIDIKEYMEKTFLDERGFGNDNMRFIVGPIDSVYEIAEQHKGVEIQELIARGKQTGGGMSSIWMLQNKPKEELFFK